MTVDFVGKRRLEVDLDVCQAHGRCYTLAPELFEVIDDEGRSAFVGDAIGSKDRSSVDLAEHVIASCPELAIRWAASE